MLRGLALALLLLASLPGVAAADAPGDLRITPKARDWLRERWFPGTDVRRQLGHFYYALDSATNRNAYGWSDATPWRAYAACQRSATTAGVAATCLPLVIDGAIVARSYADAHAHTAPDAWERTMWTDPLRCGQEPGDRAYWLEHAWCDAPRRGPAQAEGLVIWNHGVARTMVQYTAPAAFALRLLQRRGWDVVKINRNNLGEDATSYQRAEQTTLDQVRAARAVGYRRVALAGQSFGGRVALEVIGHTDEVFAAIAMAPGMEVAGNSRVQGPTDQRLQRARAERVAIVYPKDDALLQFPVRGPTSRAVLTERGRPWWMVDEDHGELRGHGGGTGGAFVFHFGACLADFVSAPAVPNGRFTCETSDRWPLARSLMPAVPADVRMIASPEKLPPGLGPLAGRWYGVVGETIVSWALIEGGGLDVLYTWASATNRGAAIYAARAEAGGVRFAFPSRTMVTVTPPGPGERVTIVVTPTPTETNFSVYAADRGPLRAELSRVPE